MIIRLSPLRSLPGQPETTLSVAGDVLTIDGLEYDLSPIPEGGEGWFEGDHPFIGAIRHESGHLHCTIHVFLDDDAQAHQPMDPAHWLLDAKDGPLAIPALRNQESAA